MLIMFDLKYENASSNQLYEFEINYENAFCYKLT
jgi:hypothetical protein